MHKRIAKIFNVAVHILEYVIALITLEVLIVAIARQVIADHGSPLGNIVCVLCIGGLFAIRKFLISKRDLVRELSEGDEPAQATADSAES